MQQDRDLLILLAGKIKLKYRYMKVKKKKYVIKKNIRNKTLQVQLKVILQSNGNLCIVKKYIYFIKVL